MNKKLIITAIILVSIIILAIFINRWIKKKKLEKLQQGSIDLGKQEGLSTGDDAKIISKISKVDLAAQKRIVDGTPVIELADAIYSAKSIYNDDEGLIYSTLGRLKSKASLSFLSNYFQSVYKISLIAYLQSFMSAEELGKVNNILKQLK